MERIVTALIIFILSAIAFVISIFSFKERGILLNNAYIFASEEEQNSMNKKPYYRQTAIVFLGIGITFLLIAVEFLFNLGWIFYIALITMIAIVIFAIVSSIILSIKNRHERR